MQHNYMISSMVNDTISTAPIVNNCLFSVCSEDLPLSSGRIDVVSLGLHVSCIMAEVCLCSVVVRIVPSLLHQFFNFPGKQPK